MPEFQSILRFQSIIDQKQPIRILSAFLRKKTIPHALLFTGIEGVGKKTVAMIFAMACNCLGKQEATTDPGCLDKEEPCGRCKSCRKIQSGNHPDFILVEPSGSIIRIAQIRSLCHTLALKPYEARLRVVIISSAQAMNAEASNALLKVLEEPPDRTVLILTAQETSELLPTIVSRCQHIRFNPVSPKNLTTMLVEKEGLDPAEAMIIAATAHGSFAKALSLSRSPIRTNWIKQRNWLINSIGLDITPSEPSRPISSLLALAAKLSQNKETLFDALEVIKSYLRDLVICKYDPKKIVNRDLTDTIQSVSQKISEKWLLEKIKDIQTAQEYILANTNIRLTIELLILRLADLRSRMSVSGDPGQIK